MSAQQASTLLRGAEKHKDIRATSRRSIYELATTFAISGGRDEVSFRLLAKSLQGLLWNLSLRYGLMARKRLVATFRGAT